MTEKASKKPNLDYCPYCRVILSLEIEKGHETKNWTENDISRAIKRLRDYSFSWCKGIEEYLPTAGGYDYERIEAKETELIIQGILNKRK